MNNINIVDVQLTSAELYNASQEDVEELVNSISGLPESALAKPLEIRRAKGEPVTIVTFAIALTLATIPVLVDKFLEWQKTKQFTEINIELESNTKKISATVNIADPSKVKKTMEVLIQQMEDILND